VIAALSTLLVAFASAFVPAIPIEPYLAGAVLTTSASGLFLGIAAGVGQTAGKALIFLGTRGAVRSAWLRSWLARRRKGRAGTGTGRFARAGRRLLDLLDQRWFAVPVVLLSAVVGLPPLLLVSVYAARTRMGVLTFAAVCLVGRSARFVAVAYAVR